METENNSIVNFLSLDEYANNLYCVSEELHNNRLKYYQFQAKSVEADYFYCLDSELEKDKIPFIYIFDYRNQYLDEQKLALINKKIWTIGDIAIAVIVYSDEFKIIDTRQPVKISSEGELTANILFPTISKIDKKLKKIIFSGRILEEKPTDYLSVSPYVKLLEHIDKNILSKKDKIGCSPHTLRSLIVKCILIKYLEEQVDDSGENIFKNNFFSSFINDPKKNTTFCDVIKDGNILDLFAKLNQKFNGGVFNLTNEEAEEISKSDLTTIAIALDGRFGQDGQGAFWKLYDLKFIPIEFISRLYERFILSVDGRQKKDGAYYTPPHLARLLIDELLPFDEKVDFENFKLLDPSCGSGIFLVLAYKRLITLWMLQNNKTKVEGEKDIYELKQILSNCIYGVDINPDAISITATSLQIEYTSHFNPKDIDLIQFDNLIIRGNLGVKGIFKWYKETDLQFNVIVGNPPFNIDKSENILNAEIGLDNICDNEYYLNEKDKKIDFPYKNPALTIFYKSLEKLLKPSGSLFMIMPSSAFLYNPTSLQFRKTIFSKWNIQKIYDFTPLKDFLWGKTKVATIAILVQNIGSKQKPIEHIIVRSSYLNHKGALRFQIDKYDRFQVPFERSLTDKYYWKTNLLGGGRLHFYVDKYLSNNEISVKSLMKDYTGFRSDISSLNQIDLKGMELLDSKNFVQDTIEGATYIQEEHLVKRNINADILNPPNILIRLNANYSMPIVFNTKKIGFFPGVLGLKGENDLVMKRFVEIFKINRLIYRTLIKLLSSKIYMQQSGEYSIDAQDIMNLPLKLDAEGKLIAFDGLSEIENAVWDDTELLAQSINKTTGSLFNDATSLNLEKYSLAFCEIMNYLYENGDYKFRTKRIIIDEDWVWVTLCHTDINQSIESILSDKNEKTYKNILQDDVSNNGLRINRIVTYINEPNCISFLKPRTLKYWTQSIAYRDAEEVKSIMFKKGY
ncbi:HsdM family class I SAM-dependent methyltransferase [Flavobacterium sp. WC2509]|uniref:HsdM family class I SAM-dependent methyltransferase n=1 Tax=Flavobacterium sp. WC2509 TaxID=3461406 RepID=UPI0040449659